MTLTLAGQAFKAGADGIAHISVDRMGVYSLTVPAEEIIQPNVRGKFAGWGDGIYTPARNVKIPAKAPLEVGFNLDYLVTLKFTQSGDVAVDPQRISSLTLSSSIGRQVTIDRIEPTWLQGGQVVNGPEHLEERVVRYAVESVMVDGADVVNQSPRRFVPRAGEEWTIPVLFYTAHFSARDALFGFPIGSRVYLTYPDRRTQWFALGPDGQASVAALARGEYRVKLDGGGLAPARPLVLGRSQDVPVLLVSYLDFCILALPALGLLLLGRGRSWLVRLRRSGRPRLAPGPAAASRELQEGESFAPMEEQC